MAGYVTSPRSCLRNSIYAAQEVGLRLNFGDSSIWNAADLDHIKGFPKNKETLAVIREAIDTGMHVQLAAPGLPFRSFYALEIGKVLPSSLKAKGITKEQARAALESPDIERPKAFLRQLRALRKYYLNPVADILPPGVMGWTRIDIDKMMDAKFGGLFAAAFQPNIYMRFGRSPVKASLDLAHFVAQRKLESDGRTMHLFYRSMEVMLQLRTARDAGYNDRRFTYTLDFRALTPSYIAVSHLNQMDVDAYLDEMDLTCSQNFLVRTSALHIKDEPKGPAYPDRFPVPGSGYIR